MRRGFKKLKLTAAGGGVTDDVIVGYYDAYLPKLKSLIAFSVLRQLFAPSVESLVVLDKLCYLKEECAAVKSGFAVRLFDPVESPRCYALVALK